MNEAHILIIDLGSQYTLIIERTLRELRYRSAVLSPGKAKDWITTSKPKCIILSGGSDSVYNDNAPQPPAEILSLDIPILGICYGMHWLVTAFGGSIQSETQKREYGETKMAYISSSNSSLLFGITGNHTAWASHGDSIKKLPHGFIVTADSNNTETISAIESINGQFFGIQFHPEVTHTKYGADILNNFVSTISKCNRDWQPKDIIANARNATVSVIGNKKAIIGFSGGVDSTTLSAIIAPTLGNQVRGVCIDTGGLRQGEIDEIKFNAHAANIKLMIIHAAKQFQKVLKGITDAEKKRTAFKKLYVKLLENAAADFGAEFIIQGSLATDYIESGGVGKSALIKSHHNIGNNWKLKDLHPIRHLFKYEVRALAKELDLPESITQRPPFPGPGLFIRIIGMPVTIPKLAIVREADAIVTKILKKHNVYDDISQLIVALLGIKTVGIKGDGRSYAYPILVRGVVTRDFMTVSGYHFSPEIQQEIEKAVTIHAEINRVWFDPTNKPPATTELE